MLSFSDGCTPSPPPPPSPHNTTSTTTTSSPPPHNTRKETGGGRGVIDYLLAGCAVQQNKTKKIKNNLRKFTIEANKWLIGT
jgi:hypothetical protein